MIEEPRLAIEEPRVREGPLGPLILVRVEPSGGVLAARGASQDASLREAAHPHRTFPRRATARRASDSSPDCD